MGTAVGQGVAGAALREGARWPERDWSRGGREEGHVPGLWPGVHMCELCPARGPAGLAAAVGAPPAEPTFSGTARASQGECCVHLPVRAGPGHAAVSVGAAVRASVPCVGDPRVFPPACAPECVCASGSLVCPPVCSHACLGESHPGRSEGTEGGRQEKLACGQVARPVSPGAPRSLCLCTSRRAGGAFPT